MLPTLSIEKRIRDQVRTRLAAADGFNSTQNSLAAVYGVTPFTINFGAGTMNFFQGQVDANQIELSTEFKYPMMMLYALRFEDDNEQKFQRFSGNIEVGLDVHYSHNVSRAIPDFESTGDCISAAIVDVLNRESNQAWDMDTVYNGNVSCVRFPLKFGAQGWRQSLRFSLKFQVHEQ